MLMVRTSFVGTYCECGIEEQDTLRCPAVQIATHRWLATDVGGYFAIDIHKRGRWLHTLGNGKTQPMCLTGFVIRVLTQNDNLYNI